MVLSALEAARHVQYTENALCQRESSVQTLISQRIFRSVMMVLATLVYQFRTSLVREQPPNVTISVETLCVCGGISKFSMLITHLASERA
jgi:hypothetical protein